MSLEITRSFIEGRGLDHDEVVTVRKLVGACPWALRNKDLAGNVPIEGEYKGWRTA
jgi:hypothetical protein